MALVREAFNEALMGDEEPLAVLQLLKCALSTEQFDGLQAACVQEHSRCEARDAPWTAWAEFGKHAHRILQDSSSRKKCWPSTVISSAFQRAGWLDRQRVRQTFHVSVSRASWEQSKKSRPEDMPLVAASDNGRKGYRAFPQEKFVTGASCQHKIQASRIPLGSVAVQWPVV